MLPQSARGRECFPRLCRIQKHIFYAAGIYLFLIDKNVLITMVSILINKNMFEPNFKNLNSQSETAMTFAPT